MSDSKKPWPYRSRMEQRMMEFVAPNIESGKPHVLAGISAFQYSGLCPLNPTELRVYIPYPLFNDLFLAGRVHYFYQDPIDTEYCVHFHPWCPYILVPSPERAIVETILYSMPGIDEGEFLESLSRYYYTPGLFNAELLQDAASHFGLDSAVLEYWKKESDDYMAEF